MEQKGELISYRPDIKVVDCTIRDGGLVNNFYFDDEFVKKFIYRQRGSRCRIHGVRL